MLPPEGTLPHRGPVALSATTSDKLPGVKLGTSPCCWLGRAGPRARCRGWAAATARGSEPEMPSGIGARRPGACQADPDGREQDAAYACFIESETVRLRTVAIEPARDHGSDGGAARSGPGRTRQQRSGEGLPRRLRDGPSDDPERARQRACSNDGGKGKAAVEHRQIDNNASTE